MKRKTFLFALLVAAYPARLALGDVFVFDNQDDFHLFMEGKKVQKGVTEDFEHGNVPPDTVAFLFGTLEFGVPNVDPAGGYGFPNGLLNENLIIQTNLFEQNAPVIEPGGPIVAIGRGVFFDDLPNSVVVGPNIPSESLDLIFDPAENHTGVGFNYLEATFKGIVFITVFNKNDEIIFKEVFEAGLEKRFFGIWSFETIGRINIGGPGAELVDNIEMWVPAPGALALLGVAGLLGGRCRRRQ